ncbi:MAG: GntR family transcriptional regulator [Liquorilactobacillus ghanensis]|uniref:GntR family transcriptional regulator n=1 Tax=Liquorilactobacillus ghanensis TaxID=399370 RepID=UPI0039EC95BA
MEITKFKANLPIYLQVSDLLAERIIRGSYPVNSKVPSVRELAEELTTNPRTIQNALKELIDAQILITRRGQGNFVTSDRSKIIELKQQRVKQKTAEYLDSLQPFLSWNEIITAVEREIAKRKEQ